MTSFDTIIDMALVSLEDYNLTNLYKLDEEMFYKKMDSYLLKGVTKFTECRQSLEYDTTTREFVSDLDMFEVNILSDWLVYVWYESKMQNILEFTEPLSDREFNRYSTGQNLNARETHLNNLYVKIRQQTVDYKNKYITEYNLFGGLM